jgi:hypothetical protein
MEDHLVSILKNIFKNKKLGWVKISEPTVSGSMGSTFYKNLQVQVLANSGLFLRMASKFISNRFSILWILVFPKFSHQVLMTFLSCSFNFPMDSRSSQNVPQHVPKTIIENKLRNITAYLCKGHFHSAIGDAFILKLRTKT